MQRTTRRQALEQKRAAASLATTVMGCSDICRLLLPALPFSAFVSLRCSCRAIHSATQAVCEDLVAVLEKAAALYVSPRYLEALQLVSDHQPHLSWLIQTPALAVVTSDRYEEVVEGAYHLLQAHLTRMQKLAVSLVLRRAASLRRGSSLRRCRLLHMGVRLGMFTESARQLLELHRAAEDAVQGIESYYAGQLEQPPTIAAAHYTLAGFYTYHHRRSELGDALKKAQLHLQQALKIQCNKLGPLHISTLCSQLVKSQVMLMLDNTAGCGRLLDKQLVYCERALGADHPLAAKMLAVMARLQLKLGNDARCDELQRRVLQMRHEALGQAHEDTHRSAMDVYARRRQTVIRNPYDPDALRLMADAMRTCLEMLRRASLEQGGVRGFCLSKSLQAMAETSFTDLMLLAKRGFWPRDTTLHLLEVGARVADRLPEKAFEVDAADLEAWELHVGVGGVGYLPPGALPAAADAAAAAAPAAVTLGRHKDAAKLRELRDHIQQQHTTAADRAAWHAQAAAAHA